MDHMPPEGRESSKDNPGGRPGDTRSFKMLTPGTTISHYRIIEKIGEGGMGVVYKAEDTRLKRVVALKFLPPRLLCDAGARARFEQEAQSASALNHPNITTIYEIDEADDRCFIAMEYVDGKSLKNLIAEGRLSIEEILDYSMQAARGLDAAHRKGVVHRDIKSDNIMVNSEGTVKITDFGLAKLRGVTRITREGSTIGTLRYMSPEQLKYTDVDHRSDLFSLGVVMYEMITGRLPFRGDDDGSLINSILHQTPEPLARYKTGISDGLQSIVDKALAKDKEERYQHADGMAADLKRERRLSDRVDRTEVMEIAAGESRRRTWGLVAALAVVAAAIILYFVLEPFRVEMGPDREAVAEDNSLAIMYFENMVDPEDTDRTGQMVTALLITDLSESEYVRVLSRQRLYDILVRLGKQDQKVIDKSVATEVAREAGVRWILTGTVIQAEAVILTSEISDAETGEIRASQRVAAGAGDDLFAMIDRLTVEIRKDLALPEAASAEIDRDIADVTTHSQEAYRHYLEGIDLYDRYLRNEAEASFKKAVEYDSTFAMAYYYLSTLSVGDEVDLYRRKALRYSANASKVEQLYLRSYDAFCSNDFEETLRLGREILKIEPGNKLTHYTLAVIYSQILGLQREAIYHMKRLLEIDPDYSLAYNQLAYAYHTLGDQDSSLWAINMYIDSAPDEPNPYDTRGDLYAYAGKLDKAIESYAKAEERRPGFSILKIGHMHLFKGNYARAESCYLVGASGDDRWERSKARCFVAVVPMYQGKFQEALALLDDAIGADEMEQTLGYRYGDKYRLAAGMYLELGDYDRAVELAGLRRDALMRASPDNAEYRFQFYVHVLALAGRVEEAWEELRSYERIVGSENRALPFSYYLEKGNIFRAAGQPDSGVVYFERALEVMPTPYFHVRHMLGEAYLEAGRVDKAVDMLEQAVTSYDDARVLVPVRAATAYHLLGRAYEESGWTDRAIEQYETFLEIWKDADPGIPSLEDARQRLERLKAAG
jgi:tetratricopeptide (TPR) repeat protein/predicted Ser/Thr protein kinase